MLRGVDKSTRQDDDHGNGRVQHHVLLLREDPDHLPALHHDATDWPEEVVGDKVTNTTYKRKHRTHRDLVQKF